MENAETVRDIDDARQHFETHVTEPNPNASSAVLSPKTRGEADLNQRADRRTAY